jgi:hypothetical protein
VLSAADAAQLAEAERRDKEVAKHDVTMLIAAIEQFKTTHRRLPYDGELRDAWRAKHGNLEFPEDEESEEPYVYQTNGRAYLLVSTAPESSYLSENGGQWGNYVDLSLSPRSSTSGPAQP